MVDVRESKGFAMHPAKDEKAHSLGTVSNLLRPRAYISEYRFSIFAVPLVTCEHSAQFSFT